jgi:hypothetical protein
MIADLVLLDILSRTMTRSEGDRRMASTRQRRKVSKVMREHKKGKLKSGSGKKVKSRKQAIAIAMSESGQSKRRKKKK